MRRNHGNSLISIMVGLALVSLLLYGVFQLYASINTNAAQVRKTNLLSINSGTALLKMTKEIRLAGSFGCFNSHIITKKVALGMIESIPNNITGAGRFESAFNGIKVFSSSAIPAADSGALNLTNDNLVNASEILKIQYASRQAFISSFAINGDSLAVINLESPSYALAASNNLTKSAINKYSLDFNNSSNALYLLSSCSRIDQIQGGLVGTTLTINGALQKIPLSAHDSSSWQLMNMETRYYYLATYNGIKSLYSKFLKSDGSISKSELVIRGVNKINYSFEVESAASYQNKTLINMLGSDWNNIKQLTIQLELQAIETESSPSPLIESLSQTIAIGN